MSSYVLAEARGWGPRANACGSADCWDWGRMLTRYVWWCGGQEGVKKTVDVLSNDLTGDKIRDSKNWE